MKQIILLSLSFFLILFFSCEHADNPVSSDLSEFQNTQFQKPVSNAQNNKIPVQGQFILTEVVTWGEQGENPVSAGLAEQQFNSVNKVGTASDLKTHVEGQFF